MSIANRMIGREEVDRALNESGTAIPVSNHGAEPPRRALVLGRSYKLSIALVALSGPAVRGGEKPSEKAGMPSARRAEARNASDTNTENGIQGETGNVTS